MAELTGTKTIADVDAVLHIDNLHTYFYTDIGVPLRCIVG